CSLGDNETRTFHSSGFCPWLYVTVIGSLTKLLTLARLSITIWIGIVTGASFFPVILKSLNRRTTVSAVVSWNGIPLRRKNPRKASEPGPKKPDGMGSLEKLKDVPVRIVSR